MAVANEVTVYNCTKGTAHTIRLYGLQQRSQPSLQSHKPSLQQYIESRQHKPTGTQHESYIHRNGGPNTLRHSQRKPRIMYFDM